jgi:hypothetical protein
LRRCEKRYQLAAEGKQILSNAFVTKLSGHGQLSMEDIGLLDALCGTQRNFPARKDLIREGDDPGPIFIILKGAKSRPF